jgi:deoxycytidylate deaminase
MQTKYIHKTDNEYMYHALKTAGKSDMRSKHGCIIIDKKGNIISLASNKTIPVVQKIFDKKNTDKSVKVSIHAEEHALRSTDPRKLCGAKLYVIRWGYLDTNPVFMNSKPCKRCTNIIETCMRKYGLKVAYYST